MFTLNVHSIRIGIRIGRMRIECALITFILHFELRGITTLPRDLRGMDNGFQRRDRCACSGFLVELRSAVLETS